MVQIIQGLYVIADRAEKLQEAFQAGAKLGQLRCKDLTGQALRLEAEKALDAAHESDAKLIINDDLQLAESIGAFAVHLGQEDLSKYSRDELKNRNVKLGISTHSLKELAIAKSYNPDYVALGPIFQTTCKSMAFGPQGLLRIKEWKQFYSGPLVAIGGLKPETAAQSLALGADAVAVISDIFQHPTEGIAARTRLWLSASTSSTLSPTLKLRRT